MYYLLNQTHQIIAADENLLALCGVSHIDELSSKIILGESTFDSVSEDKIMINNDQTYAISKTALSSMLGDLTLVNISLAKTSEAEIETRISELLSEENIFDASTISDTKEENLEGIMPLDLDTDLISIESESDEEDFEDLFSPKEEVEKPLEKTEDIQINIDTISQDDEEDFEDLFSPKEEVEKPLEKTEDIQINIDTISQDDEEDFEDLFSPKEEVEKPLEKTEDIQINIDTISQDDDEEDFEDLFSPKEEVEKPLEKTEDIQINIDTISQDDEEDFEDLFSPKEEVENVAENLSQIESTEEILIDIDTISQEMGVSHEDYNAFLEEYIDTALDLETDLQSQDKNKRADAIATLTQLADMLHLPLLKDIIKKLSTAGTNKNAITSFYATLSRLTTETSKKEPEETSPELFNITPEEVKIAPEVKIETEEVNIAPVVKSIAEIKAKKVVNTNSFGTISLEGIKPIHFDFQLEEAANDLNLPVDLIEEFVNDFIDQGHIETKKMLKFYEEGNLDAIQKIGHLLKGASSNLRINTLSDTLYEIQFCEDPKNLETFIKEYWGHFLSFEIQIHALAK
ncbi:MAG: hypothetical protein Q9M39_10310 [Sulfurovum sp.]|nr:hypothetical protein [Sulfurovum sp.]